MKTLKMLLYLASVALCLVFFLTSAMDVSNPKQKLVLVQIVAQWIEPACFLICCIGISITPVRTIPAPIRKTLALGSTLLIGLYYLFVVFTDQDSASQATNTVSQLDAWVIILLLILTTYTLTLFRPEHKAASAPSQEDDLIIDPLLHISNKSAPQPHPEEIEMEITGAPLGSSIKRWRRTT